MSARRWPQLLPACPSLRPSVRSTSSPLPPQPGRPGPAQRRPEQSRPCEETGAAPARPCPRPPSRLSVRLSLQPPARASVLLSGRQPSGGSPRSARFVSPRLSVSLSLPSRCLTAPPSISGPPNALLSSLRASHSERPHSSELPPHRVPTFLGVVYPSEHRPHPQGSLLSFPYILWWLSLPSAPPNPWVLTAP